MRARVGPGSAPLRVDGANRRHAPAGLDGDRIAARTRRAGLGRHRRQPSRRLGLRRRRSVDGNGSMLELVRVLGTLAPRRLESEALAALRELGRRGVRPHLVDRMGRTARRVAAQSRAVAYLNVDSAASGSRFVAGAIAIAAAAACRRRRHGTRSIDQVLGALRGTRPGRARTAGSFQPERTATSSPIASAADRITPFS